MKLPARSVRINGNMLRRFRTLRGMTQQELARLSGYSDRLMRKAESCGSLDIETVRNIAEALSTVDEVVTLSQLTLDNRMIAREWMDALNEQGPKIAEKMSPYLASDFAFYFPGAVETAPFVGSWLGIEGLSRFSDLYFGSFQRYPHRDVVYGVADDLIIARFLESGCFGCQSKSVAFRVNMVFHFRQGMIHRIDNDCDTQTLACAMTECERPKVFHL